MIAAARRAASAYRTRGRPLRKFGGTGPHSAHTMRPVRRGGSSAHSSCSFLKCRNVTPTGRAARSARARRHSVRGAASAVRATLLLLSFGPRSIAATGTPVFAATSGTFVTSSTSCPRRRSASSRSTFAYSAPPRSFVVWMETMRSRPTGAAYYPRVRPLPPPALRSLVVEQPDALDPYLDAWDALAAEAGRPFCTPAWMLAWWRDGREGDARLRVVLALDEAGTARSASARSSRRSVRSSSRSTACSAPASATASGRSRAPVASATSRRRSPPGSPPPTPPPASVVFEGIDAADPWPELVAGAWPSRRRPRVRTDVTMDSPAIALDGDYEAWMARRERKFRKEARRVARRLEEEGVIGRLATDDAAVDALLRLHYARWEGRGGSNVGGEARAVIAGAARALNDDARLAVALLEGPDGPVAADLVLRAGDAIGFWGGGFDPAWAKHAPGTQTMLLALEAAAASGARSADLGGGAHDYKWRLSDENRPLAWRTLFPPGPRYPLIRLRLAPKHLRFAARRLARRLPDERQAQLRRLLRRGV